jgi:hypothetical protein
MINAAVGTVQLYDVGSGDTLYAAISSGTRSPRNVPRCRFSQSSMT